MTPADSPNLYRFVIIFHFNFQNPANVVTVTVNNTQAFFPGTKVPFLGALSYKRTLIMPLFDAHSTTANSDAVTLFTPMGAHQVCSALLIEHFSGRCYITLIRDGSVKPEIAQNSPRPHSQALHLLDFTVFVFQNSNFEDLRQYIS